MKGQCSGKQSDIVKIKMKPMWIQLLVLSLVSLSLALEGEEDVISTKYLPLTWLKFVNS